MQTKPPTFSDGNGAGVSVGIVGCGPAGLCAALYLRRIGFAVTIFEEFEQAKPVGSGLMLQPTGMSVLAELDLLDAVIARGSRIDRIFGCDAKSLKPVLDVYYSQLGSDQFGLGINRDDLFFVLFEAAKHADIDFEFGQEIVRIEESATGGYLINACGVKSAQFDFLVVADGSKSTIAHEYFDINPVDDLPFGALWVTLDHDLPLVNCNMLEQRYRGASKMLGLLPLGESDNEQKRVAMFWSLKGAELDALHSAGIYAWKEEVCKAWPLTNGLVSKIDNFDAMTFASYRHFTLAKPFGRRVAFIGDAFHSTSPQLGQGANMAFLDAKAIGFALGQNRNRLDEAGAMYYAMRRRQITIYQTLSRILTPFYQSDSWALGVFRDRVVSQIVKVPPAPRMMAQMVSGLFAAPFKEGMFGEERLELDIRKLSSN